MDITNSIGGLGVLGGRAFVRKRNSIAYQEFKLNNKRPGFESRNPIIFQKERPLLIFNNHQPIYLYLTESLFR